MTTSDRASKSDASLSPLSSRAALDAYFLEARCKLLDLAAILDRIGRGDGGSEPQKDARLASIHQALEVLHDESGGRAERIQRIFSLDYDAGWERPKPK